MVELPNFACLLIDDIYTRAHISRMIEKGVKPSYVIVIKAPRHGYRSSTVSLLTRFPVFRLPRKLKRKLRRSAFDFRYVVEKFGSDAILIYDLTEILSSQSIDFDVVYAKNVNEEIIIDRLASSRQEYFFVVAPGILRRKLFNLQKKYINAHKGILPDVRGSSATS